MKVDWKELLKTVAPTVLAITIPGAGPVLGGLVAHGIDVATSHPGSGEEKLNVAYQEILTGVQGVNAVRPGTIDEALLGDAFKSSVGVTYDVLHLLHKSAAPEAPASPVAPPNVPQ